MRKIIFKNLTFAKVKRALAKLRMKFKKRVTFIAKLHFNRIFGNSYDGYFNIYPD